MAGDWIKMRTNLDTDPRVIAIGAELNLPELYVVGMLWKVWSWADAHSIDGNAIRVTDVTLDRFTSVTGFATALRKAGWLEGRDNALTFPRFAEHNGHTAKNRAETKVRVAKHRNGKAVTDVTQKLLPEKRREEKSVGDKSPTTPQRFVPPTVEEVRVFCEGRQNGIDPEAFVAHYKSNGWKVGGKAPMKDWHAAIITWEKTRAEEKKNGNQPRRTATAGQYAAQRYQGD